MANKIIHKSKKPPVADKKRFDACLGNGGHSRSLKGFVENDLEGVVLAFVGKSVEDLQKRLGQYRGMTDIFPPCIHPTAIVHPDVSIAQGVQILAGAVVNPGASLNDCCVINTGAIIEHGAVIGAGTHVAPGAIVLGDAKVGECCWIGAGAVVIQGVTVPDNTFVKALSIYKRIDKEC